MIENKSTEKEMPAIYKKVIGSQKEFRERYERWN
jgi:hypothetical protein